MGFSSDRARHHRRPKVNPAKRVPREPHRRCRSRPAHAELRYRLAWNSATDVGHREPDRPARRATDGRAGCADLARRLRLSRPPAGTAGRCPGPVVGSSGCLVVLMPAGSSADMEIAVRVPVPVPVPGPVPSGGPVEFDGLVAGSSRWTTDCIVQCKLSFTTRTRRAGARR